MVLFVVVLQLETILWWVSVWLNLCGHQLSSYVNYYKWNDWVKGYIILHWSSERLYRVKCALDLVPASLMWGVHWLPPPAITHLPAISPLTPARDVVLILSFPSFRGGKAHPSLFHFSPSISGLDLSSPGSKQGSLTLPRTFFRISGKKQRPGWSYWATAWKAGRSAEAHFSSWIVGGSKYVPWQMPRALGRVGHGSTREEGGWLHLARLVRGGAELAAPEWC